MPYFSQLSLTKKISKNKSELPRKPVDKVMLKLPKVDLVDEVHEDYLGGSGRAGCSTNRHS